MLAYFIHIASEVYLAAYCAISSLKKDYCVYSRTVYTHQHYQLVDRTIVKINSYECYGFTSYGK